MGLPRPTHYRKFPSCCWQIQLFLTSRKSFLIFVNSHENHVFNLALGASKTGLIRSVWEKRGPGMLKGDPGALGL